jgi:hypothetical protein
VPNFRSFFINSTSLPADQPGDNHINVHKLQISFGFGCLVPCTALAALLLLGSPNIKSDSPFADFKDVFGNINDYKKAKDGFVSG